MKKINVIKAFSFAVLFMGLYFAGIVAMATEIYWSLLWLPLAWIMGVLHGYENGKAFRERQESAEKLVGKS